MYISGAGVDSDIATVQKSPMILSSVFPSGTAEARLLRLSTWMVSMRVPSWLKQDTSTARALRDVGMTFQPSRDSL